MIQVVVFLLLVAGAVGDEEVNWAEWKDLASEMQSAVDKKSKEALWETITKVMDKYHGKSTLWYVGLKTGEETGVAVGYTDAYSGTEFVLDPKVWANSLRSIQHLKWTGRKDVIFLATPEGQEFGNITEYSWWVTMVPWYKNIPNYVPMIGLKSEGTVRMPCQNYNGKSDVVHKLKKALGDIPLILPASMYCPEAILAKYSGAIVVGRTRKVNRSGGKAVEYVEVTSWEDLRNADEGENQEAEEFIRAKQHFLE